MTFNANLQATLVEHCIITSSFVGTLYLNSVPVVVEGIFFRATSQRGKKNIRKSSNKAGFEECAPSSRNSVSSGAKARPTSSRQIKTFSERLKKKFTSNPQILELMEGYEIPFSSESK